MQITSQMRVLENALKTEGFRVWAVGGCVRDSICGVTPKDFDFTTDATPAEQVATYEKHDIRYIETGIQHGTISVVIDDEVFEVTTLRTESDHDGRYATMTFTRSLEDDLGRRDLTINAMAMDFEGNLIDPYGGQDDLRLRSVRFVGNPIDRIREDYLRILRWVRFHQRFASGMAYDPLTRAAVEGEAKGLRNISVERIWSEVSKALTYDYADLMLDMLNETGIARYIGMPTGFAANVYMLGNRTRDPITRLAAYYRRTEILIGLADKWKWSNEERKQAVVISSLLRDKFLDKRAQRFYVAVDGMDPYHVAEAARIANEPTDIESWEVPVFPVSGDDLKARGIKPSPAMGQMLRDIKAAWAESDYTASKVELLRGL